jgi:predicted TIM-barrel fold metal-dependent hydrolase
MSDPIVFALVPLSGLREHEEVVEAKVRALARELRRRRVFVDPIWVARGSNIILNGHHRAAAARRLGAERIPAWIVDYDSDLVLLARWTPGPPISKAEVVRRAAEGRRFPPRTTRHSLAVPVPARPTPISELGGPLARAPAPAPARRVGARGARGSRRHATGSPPG